MAALMPVPSCFLSQMLPYDPSTKIHVMLRSGLKEYTLLLCATSRAINALKTGDLEQFDALVGENACQIRAVKVAMTAMTCLEEVKSIESRITYIEERITKIMTSLDRYMKKSISLEDLLKTNELDLALPQEFLFLLQSYLLTQAKTLRTSKEETPIFRNSVADPKRLQALGDVTNKFADNLLRKLRQDLSALSVLFVREQAIKSRDPHLIKMTDDSFTISHNSWLTVPMFWSYKTLLLTAHSSKIPLLFHAIFSDIEEELLFMPSSDEAKPYHSCASTCVPFTGIVIVIQGTVITAESDIFSRAAWKSKMEFYGTDIILAGSADHRQYPDPSKERLLDGTEDADYKRYRTLALTEGFSSSNPSTFFINHVYTKVYTSSK